MVSPPSRNVSASSTTTASSRSTGAMPTRRIVRNKRAPQLSLPILYRTMLFWLAAAFRGWRTSDEGAANMMPDVLQSLLEKHQAWFLKKNGGARLNLSLADLQGCDFRK